MTIPEIWKKLNEKRPTKCAYELACFLATVDEQTQIETINKWTEDLKISQKNLIDEIKKQQWRKKINELQFNNNIRL